jgi:hypothetical protein
VIFSGRLHSSFFRGCLFTQARCMHQSVHLGQLPHLPHLSLGRWDGQATLCTTA